MIPPSRIHSAAPNPNSASASASRLVLGGVERELARAHARQNCAPSASERAEEVLLDLPFGVVVVDRNYDMQIINATARRLLGIHSPALGQDVIHLAHRALRDPLRDAVDAARNGINRRAVHELSTLPDVPGAPRYIEISSYAARAHPERPDVPELIVVLIVDATERERLMREQSGALSEADARMKHMQELLDESTRSVRELLDANQELSSANVGLRSANEELLVGNEEAQAAMEEIETLFPLHGLTAREREVADLVARGYSNQQIANALVLTRGTVANHVAHILAKLGAANRTQVAAWVLDRTAVGTDEGALGVSAAVAPAPMYLRGSQHRVATPAD